MSIKPGDEPQTLDRARTLGAQARHEALLTKTHRGDEACVSFVSDVRLFSRLVACHLPDAESRSESPSESVSDCEDCEDCEDAVEPAVVFLL